MTHRDTGRLLISCQDRPGIVASVTRFLAEHASNIHELDQYSTDPEDGRFFMRTVFHREDLARHKPQIADDFARFVAGPFDMDWRLEDADRPKRVAVLVSKEDHCALDLLWRWRRGELPLDIGLVISNHQAMEEAVNGFGVRFEHVPVSKETKPAAEQRQLELLHGYGPDLVVLARYMQILSGGFLAQLGAPVINIHHSFLPAFAGAGPYQRAKERGVKLVGATAHYVIEELDAGPIIDQDVARVSHRDTVGDLIRLGADIERTVLTRAVRLHCEDRVLLDGTTTVVF